MFRAFVGAAFWDDSAGCKADEVDVSALGEHFLYLCVLFGLRQFGGELGFGVGDLVLFEHGADLCHACGGFLVGSGDGVDEFCLFQRF